MGPPKNGFYIKGTRNKGDMIKHGERINYDCIGSYSLVGNSTQGCSDGQWSNPSPTCKGIYNKVNLLGYLISELNQESLLFFSFWGGYSLDILAVNDLARIAKIARITILSNGKAYKQEKERKPWSNIFISKL